MYKRTMIDSYDILGLLGVIFNLYAYTRVQWRREYAKSMGFSVTNLAGATCLAVSLLNKWNLASFTGNVIWAFLSIYGIYRCAKYMRGARATAEIGQP